MEARLVSLVSRACRRVSPRRGNRGRGIPVPRLLAQMDGYDWDSVDDIDVSQVERSRRTGQFRELIYQSGMLLDGSVLDLASGAVSVATSCPGVIAVDNDPQKIKRLRQDGVKAIVADIENLPFEEKSFDYVVSISPPLRPKVLRKNGYVSFSVDPEWNEKLVAAALRIARKEVLIASHFIAREPPRQELVEKRDSDSLQWVLYRANQDGRAE